MILVSCSTHFQPFDRLVKAADLVAADIDEKVIIQTGCSTIECKHAETFVACPREKMQELQREANIIVMQGGWGGICECTELKKRIICVPRIEGPEHIHNQIQLVRKTDEIGCVIGVYVDKNDDILPEDIFRKDKTVFDDYVEQTRKGLMEAIEKAKSYDYKPLVRGNSHIIKETIDGWFSK